MQVTFIFVVVILTIMFDSIKSELSSKEFEQIFLKISKVKLIQSCWGVESSKSFFRQLSETVEECDQLSPLFNIDLFGNGKTNNPEDSTEITSTTEVRNNLFIIRLLMSTNTLLHRDRSKKLACSSENSFSSMV